MSNSNNNRVLGRIGAHMLTQEEAEAVSGGIISTLLSHIITNVLNNPDSLRDS